MVRNPAKVKKNSPLVHIIQPIQWLLMTLLPGIQQLRHDAYNSPPNRAKVKNGCSYTSAPHMPLWHNSNEPLTDAILKRIYSIRKPQNIPLLAFSNLVTQEFH
jgi:hypothetical protein